MTSGTWPRRRPPASTSSPRLLALTLSALSCLSWSKTSGTPSGKCARPPSWRLVTIGFFFFFSVLYSLCYLRRQHPRGTRAIKDRFSREPGPASDHPVNLRPMRRCARHGRVDRRCHLRDCRYCDRRKQHCASPEAT